MKEWKNYLLALSGLICILLLLKGCYDNSGYESEISTLNDKLIKQESVLHVTVQKDSSRLYRIEQKLMGERHARILAEDASKRFKSISTVIKTKVEVRRDTIWIPFTGSSLTYCNDSLNKPINYTDKWFYLGGTVKSSGLLLDSIGFKPGYINVLVGEKRTGLFKRPLPVVELQIENPYLNITTANNVIVKDHRKKPLLLSRTAMLVYGFVLGTVLIR